MSQGFISSTFRQPILNITAAVLSYVKTANQYLEMKTRTRFDNVNITDTVSFKTRNENPQG